MPLDLNRKKVIKNAWRITKERELSCLRVRAPGGHLDAHHLALIQRVATEFGNGTIHITTRQGFEIPGIPFAHMAEVNALIAPYIRDVETDRGVAVPDPMAGYPAAGTRNISACIGNRVCPFATVDTTAVACRIEQTVYPHDFHVKIAVTGCPNDCIKAHMQDIGVIGTTLPQYDVDSCIGCNACEKACRKKSTGALSSVNYKIERDHRRCIGCGECVLACPTRAWTRSDVKYFKIVIMGRTGKKNPRLAVPFLLWVTEDVIHGILKNLYRYIDQYIDRTLPKEHVGYIVDRTGFPEFRKWVLEGVVLNAEARVAGQLEWPGYRMVEDVHF